MKHKIKSVIGVAVLTAIGSTTASAAPVINPITGHYYDVVPSNGITWADAKAAADATTYLGVPGHLATITSEGEDIFVESVRAAAMPDLNKPEVWVGGIQTPCESPETNEGCGWAWENGEGAISTDTFPLPSYSNWQGGEPNDLGGESHIGIGHTDTAGWNDEGNLGNIGGYVIEYDVPRQAANCSVSANGCETIAGHELTFPEGSIPVGAEIAFNAFEFDDPRVVAGTCGVEPLEIFGADTDPEDNRPSLLIPPYLCGSPRFVVIAVDSGDLNILEGTVFVENETDIVLPFNDYTCEDPIVQNFPTEGDPQYQDVVVWQTTDPNNMLEVDPGVGGVGQFAGAAGEFTNECGSSRARVKGASDYVVGMHIDFGPGNEWAANSAGNFGKFVELTRYKLVLLDESVKQARADNAISRFAYRYLLRPAVRLAIRHLDRGRYQRAHNATRYFLWLVENLVNYPIVLNENYNGEHLMRGSNIEFMLRVKVVPYAP